MVISPLDILDTPLPVAYLNYLSFEIDLIFSLLILKLLETSPLLVRLISALRMNMFSIL